MTAEYQIPETVGHDDHLYVFDGRPSLKPEDGWHVFAHISRPRRIWWTLRSLWDRIHGRYPLT